MKLRDAQRRHRRSPRSAAVIRMRTTATKACTTLRRSSVYPAGECSKPSHSSEHLTCSKVRPYIVEVYSPARPGSRGRARVYEPSYSCRAVPRERLPLLVTFAPRVRQLTRHCYVYDDWQPLCQYHAYGTVPAVTIVFAGRLLRNAFAAVGADTDGANFGCPPTGHSADDVAQATTQCALVGQCAWGETRV